jgi:hypothetical protein
MKKKFERMRQEVIMAQSQIQSQHLPEVTLKIYENLQSEQQVSELIFKLGTFRKICSCVTAFTLCTIPEFVCVVDNIKMNLREIRWDGVDWIDLAQDRDQWRDLVNTVMNLRVP